jgi:hypothetical protein
MKHVYKNASQTRPLRPSYIVNVIFICLFAVALGAPMLRHFLAPQNEPALDENRTLAQRPALPHSWREWIELPASTDAYLNDHFGFRQTLVGWQNRLRFHVLHEADSSQITLGKDGVIFLNSHVAAQPLSMINFLCGKDVSQAMRDNLADQIAEFTQNSDSINPHSLLVFVPTKPILYPDKLPNWMREQCARHTATVPSVLAALNAKSVAPARVVYPFDFMSALKDRLLVYPKENFHWDGNGPQPVAEHIASQYFGIPRTSVLAMRDEVKPSDLQRFFPGIGLPISVSTPAYLDSGVSACAGGACFPELGGIAQKLGDVSRFQRANPRGPRLLLISDSFGAGIAGYFSESFGEVWHISINNFNSLSAAEIQKLRDEMYGKYQPDKVLYLFHDYSMACFSTLKRYCPVNLNSLLEPKSPPDNIRASKKAHPAS